MATTVAAAGRTADFTFGREIQAQSRQPLNLCYQCGKCAAGCPVSFAADHSNYEILRLVQLGQKEIVLGSGMPWLCVACQTCAARCPNGINLAKVMDVLKTEAAAAGAVDRKNRRSKIFYDLFLQTMQGFPLVGGEGKAYELGLMGLYKLRTGTFFNDLNLGRKMLARGTLKLFPAGGLKARKGEIRRIFRRVREKKQ